MDRVTHYECAGWGFESLYPHHRRTRQLINPSFAVFFYNAGNIDLQISPYISLKIYSQGIEIFLGCAIIN